MTDEQYRRVCALSRCRMMAGSYEKRFCRDLRFKKSKELTANQAEYLALMWHRYRLQLMQAGSWLPPVPPDEPPSPEAA